MATRPMSQVLERLRSVGRGCGTALCSDAQLLERFVARRDEEAFAALVRRHGPMVLGVCRRVAGNADDADDAFQATFLVLARKAASLRSRELLGNWLYGTAYRTALKARSAARRRRAVEKQVHDMPHPTTEPAELWQELLPLLDEELSRLPDKYRTAVILCELEGRSRREAALQLRVPEGTLSSRLATARRLLAKRLTRRGLALSGGALAAALAQGPATAAVPAKLAAFTAKAATGPAAGVVSAKVVALTEGVLKAMFLTKLKIATVLILACGVLLSGAGALTYRMRAAEEASAAAEGPYAKPPTAPPEAKSEPARPANEADDKVWTLAFTSDNLRSVDVDLPGHKGTVWYLAYHVVNLTGAPRTFIPHFELVAGGGRAVPDKVLPGVFKAVVADLGWDDPKASPWRDSVTIAAQPIPDFGIESNSPLSKNPKVHGIALWEGVPADSKRITIFVSGLSNAFRVVKPVENGRKVIVARKTLELDFKREGDKMVFVPPEKWVYRGETAVPAKPEANPPAEGGRQTPEGQTVRRELAVAESEINRLEGELRWWEKEGPAIQAVLGQLKKDAPQVVPIDPDEIKRQGELQSLARLLAERLERGNKTFAERRTELDLLRKRAEALRKRAQEIAPPQATPRPERRPEVKEVRQLIQGLESGIARMKEEQREWEKERDELEKLRKQLGKAVPADDTNPKGAELYQAALKLGELWAVRFLNGKEEESKRVAVLKEQQKLLEDLRARLRELDPTEAERAKRAEQGRELRQQIDELEMIIAALQRERKTREIEGRDVGAITRLLEAKKKLLEDLRARLKEIAPPVEEKPKPPKDGE